MQRNKRFRSGWRESGIVLMGLFALIGAILSGGAIDAEEQLAFTDARTSVGTMQVGETKTVALTLTNHSANTIEIESISSSCPCTTAQVDQTTLKPGQATRLTAAVLHDLYVTPDVRSQLTVKEKGGSTAEATVMLEGRLESPVVAEPVVVNFDARASIDQAQTLRLRSRDGRALEISRIQTPEWLSATRDESNASVAYRVQLAHAVPYELLQGEITFWTDDLRQPVVRVPVLVSSVAGPLEVSPRIIRLSQVKPGHIGTPVVMRSSDLARPEITESIQGVDFRVEPGQTVGEFVITPIVASNATAGPVRGSIRATWKHGLREEHVDIGVIGTVVGTHTD